MQDVKGKTNSSDLFKNLKSFLKTVYFLISKDLDTHRRTIALLVIAISIGSTQYVFYMAAMSDFADKSLDRTVNTNVGHIIIEPYEGKKYINSVSTVERELLLIPGLTGASPRIDTQAVINREDELETCTVHGITPSKEDTVTILSSKIRDGTFLSDKDKESVVIGNKLADKIDADVGNKVTITYRNGERRDYLISGIIHSDLDEIDSLMVIVSLHELKDVFSLGDQATEIAIRTTDFEKVDELKYLVMQQNPHGEVKTWKDKLAFMLALVELSEYQTSLFGGITLFAASVAIVVMMYITVINRSHEIGVIKAMGGRNSLILYVFLGEAIIIGILGAFFGNFFGFLLCKYFEVNPIYDPNYGFMTPTYDLAAGISSTIVTIGTCIIAGIYPALKASRLNIIEAMRSL